MCGIAGVLGKTRNPQVKTYSKYLGMRQDDRGRDNSGVAYWTDDKKVTIIRGTDDRHLKVVHKGLDLSTLQKLFRTSQYGDLANVNVEEPSILMHSRKGSAGSVDGVNNAHPFRVRSEGKSDIVGVMNGTIYNWEEIADTLNIEVSDIDCDSEAVFRIIQHSSDSMNYLLENYEGNMALVWYERDDPHIWYVWCGKDGYTAERPLHFMIDKDGTFYLSSTKPPLNDLISLMSIKNVDKMPVQFPLDTVLMLNGYDGEVSEVSKVKRVHKDYYSSTRRGQWSGNSCGYYGAGSGYYQSGSQSNTFTAPITVPPAIYDFTSPVGDAYIGEIKAKERLDKLTAYGKRLTVWNGSYFYRDSTYSYSVCHQFPLLTGRTLNNFGDEERAHAKEHYEEFVSKIKPHKRFYVSRTRQILFRSSPSGNIFLNSDINYRYSLEKDGHLDEVFFFAGMLIESLESWRYLMYYMFTEELTCKELVKEAFNQSCAVPCNLPAIDFSPNTKTHGGIATTSLYTFNPAGKIYTVDTTDEISEFTGTVYYPYTNVQYIAKEGELKRISYLATMTKDSVYSTYADEYLNAVGMVDIEMTKELGGEVSPEKVKEYLDEDTIFDALEKMSEDLQLAEKPKTSNLLNRSSIYPARHYYHCGSCNQDSLFPASSLTLQNEEETCDRCGSPVKIEKFKSEGIVEERKELLSHALVLMGDILSREKSTLTYTEIESKCKEFMKQAQDSHLLNKVDSAVCRVYLASTIYITNISTRANRAEAYYNLYEEFTKIKKAILEDLDTEIEEDSKLLYQC